MSCAVETQKKFFRKLSLKLLYFELMKMEDNRTTDGNSADISTLYKFKTELNADSLEWCPHEPYQNFFVCGNYQLEKTTENESNRNGRILLLALDPVCGVTLHQTLSTAGVLDQKWCHNRINGFSVLGVVNSDSTLEIYKFDGSKLELVTEHRLSNNANFLLLSLDWSTGKFASQSPDILCSDSYGGWHRFNFTGKELVLLNSGKAHKHEAWIAAFYYWDTNVTFTGADDLKLNKYDQRVGCDPVAVNKNHDAGVTSIHSNAQREFLLASGCYDEFVRTWDIRQMKNYVQKEKLCGPVWRVKWNPLDFKHLLVACMGNGAHVLSLKEENGLKCVCSYYESENLTYGCDWSYMNETSVSQFGFAGNRIIGTCSFYDNLLCVSKIGLDEEIC